MSLLNVTPDRCHGLGGSADPALPARARRTPLRLWPAERLSCGAFASVYQRMYISLDAPPVDRSACACHATIWSLPFARFATVGVVAFPTETFYGLAADPRSPRAVEKIYLGQAATCRSIATIDCRDTRASRHRRLDDAARRTAGNALVARSADADHSRVHRSCAEDVHLSGTGGVAVRVPGHPIARALAEAVGHAITSTSANVSGEPPSSIAGRRGCRRLATRIDVLIDGGRRRAACHRRLSMPPATRPCSCARARSRGTAC